MSRTVAALTIAATFVCSIPFDSYESTHGLMLAQGRAGRTAGGIAYDVQGSGPVVILLTGSNLDRRMWAYETAWLSKTRTVVRYDLRAHGQSETATAPFSHLDDFLGLLDELKSPRPR